jgi:LmbE family N-acetylglucosaminyl deacetylase
MKKTAVAIFAHPDDEAMGPAGTIAKLAKTYDMHIICVTNGDAAGKTPEEKAVIAATRKEELRKSAEILGVSEVHFLEYHDGQLCNNLYQEIAEQIQKELELSQPEVVVTFEHRGVTGHLDHIAVSFITTFVTCKLPFVRKTMYYCLNKKRREQITDYFIYFPKGYEENEIDEVVDISNEWDQKVAAMYCHKSQMHDVERVHKQLSELPKIECFLVKQKVN